MCSAQLYYRTVHKRQGNVNWATEEVAAKCQVFSWVWYPSNDYYLFFSKRRDLLSVSCSPLKIQSPLLYLLRQNKKNKPDSSVPEFEPTSYPWQIVVLFVESHEYLDKSFERKADCW